jgi:hypothetical protein
LALLLVLLGPTARAAEQQGVGVPTPASVPAAAVMAGIASSGGPGLRGKVLFEGRPASGVRLHAYASAEQDFKGPGLASFGPTGDDGTFNLALHPGHYFIVGKKTVSPAPDAEPGVGELFGYYGGNPVTVSAGAVTEVNLQLVRRQPSSIVAGAGDTVRIDGVTVGPRGPLSGASIFSYPDAKSGFRGPDLTGPLGSLIEGTDSRGSFALELPPGTYYLTAARRKGAAVLGPLAPGDLFGYFDGNPLRLAAGQRATIVIQMTEKLRPVAAASAATAGVTGIRGALRDPAGKPVGGVFAFATTDPNVIGTMPPYRSLPVGADGSYFIELPAGGTYYVGARTGFGGPPQIGHWWGQYGGDANKPVAVKEGAVTEGIDVIVRRVE